MPHHAGTLQIPPHQSTIIGANQIAPLLLLATHPGLKTQIGKPFKFRLPVELLRAIFEEYLRLDLPVQVLLEVNRQWRTVALETQSLCRRLLLSADAIPGSLRAGSVHACDSEYQAELILKRSGSVTKLEVTFVLGPKESDIPTAEQRISLFKMVGHAAVDRISFLCVIVNPEMTLELVTKSLDGVFKGVLPNLESLMIASAKAIGNLYKPLMALIGLIDETSTKLKSLYLENVNKDFIIHASTKAFWKRLIRITIRNEFDSLDAEFFSRPSNLEFFSFSGELVATPAPAVAHLDSSTKHLIEFPELKWLRVSLISMGTLARLHVPKLHTMAIDCVQGAYPAPAPPPGELLIPALKVLQIVTVNPTLACINAPELDTLCISIPVLKQVDADHVLKSGVHDEDGMSAGKRKHVLPSLVAGEERSKRPIKLSSHHNASTPQTLAQSYHQQQPLQRVLDLPRAVLRGLAQLLRFMWLRQFKPESGPELYTRNEAQASCSCFQAIVAPPESLDRDLNLHTFQQLTPHEPIPTALIPGYPPLITAMTPIVKLHSPMVDIPDLSGLIAKLERVCVSRYSKVYRGAYESRMVAIKELFLIKNDHTTNRKFRRELSIWWQLRHPNIIPLYGYLQHDDGIEVSYSLVSEWADGGSAAHYIHEDLTTIQRITLIFHIVKAIKYLHDCGVVHADIKPQNVLISANGTGQLCDFGLSRLLSCWEETGLTTTTPHTGTPRYLAYELVQRGREVVPSTASDIYAFGCVAHEVLYKRAPHASLDSHFDVSQAIRNHIPPAKKPSDLKSSLSTWWDLLECCWDTDPDSRMTAGEIHDYLEQVVLI